MDAHGARGVFGGFCEAVSSLRKSVFAGGMDDIRCTSLRAENCGCVVGMEGDFIHVHIAIQVLLCATMSSNPDGKVVWSTSS